VTASPEPRTRAIPRFHVVTDDAILEDPAFVLRAAPVLEAGGASLALHLRSRSISGRALYEIATACRDAAAASGAWVLVNDRVDVALASGVDGVQLGRSSLPPETVRRIAPGLRIGASVHDNAEAESSVASGADFLLAGTLFWSESHPDREGTGVGWLERVSVLGVPTIGIGGITPDRVREVVGSGACGVAAIRGIWSQRDPAAATADYLAQLGE
jgi:thiamine-phosphate diphosphorylase